MNQAMRAAATASHAHRAAVTGGRHVIAERSGHYVPVTEPEVIAEEILRLLEAGPGPVRKPWSNG
ncbi:hypothetical protein AB0C38_08110 [Amycolatopsis sp. NPDC048633]|uniref:hypothetical protein n=1 Tax=Amycolatopsis sp. NPDC048633 TaxID=3157095 RepID=UPI0033EC68B8